jgi:RES domain-containing protein
LAALEKRVHVIDPSLLPTLMMVEYEAPDDLPQRVVDIAALPADWTVREVDTQRVGDHWLDSVTETLLVVPSVIMPLAAAPERNVLINHRHARAVDITIVSATPFTLDPRLFQP